jgi:hypothetical protein
MRREAVRHDGGAEAEQPLHDGVADAGAPARAGDERDTIGEREMGLGHGRLLFAFIHQVGLGGQRPAMGRL